MNELFSLSVVPCLTDAMASIRSLQIILWIEIRIVENDRIGCNEIQTNTTCSCAQQKDERVRLGVEIIDRQKPFFAPYGSVESCEVKLRLD